MIAEELRRLFSWKERHRRLSARVVIALGLTVVIDVVATALVWAFERHAKGTDVHTLGEAFFFTTAQLLTVSSSLKNPLTAAGRVVDLLLELWGVIVITSLAGSFAAFFHAGDSS